MALPKSIGIRLFDDSFVPVLTEGEIKNKKVILTTVKDDQKKAIIKLYEGVSDSCSQNEFLGKLVIPITRSTTKGEPGLEVHLRLDDDGMLYAKAWDVESGEQANIKIEHNDTPRIFPETLSDVEIQNLDDEENNVENIENYDEANDLDTELSLNDVEDNFDMPLDNIDEFDIDSNNNEISDNIEEDNNDLSFEEDDDVENEINDEDFNQTAKYNSIEDDEEKDDNYVEEKQNDKKGLKTILIIIIIILLLVLLGLGIYGLYTYFSTKKPAPEKPVVTVTTVESLPEFEEVTTTTTTTTVAKATTTTTVYIESKGVKQLDGKQHFIRRGENLWNICKKYYGDPWYYPDLAKYNDLRSPRLIRAGKTLIIPDKSQLTRWDFSK